MAALFVVFLNPLLTYAQMPEDARKQVDELDQQIMELDEAGKYQEAIPLAQQVLSIHEKALGPEHPNVTAALNRLALLYREMRDYAKAEALYRRALEIDEKAHGPDHRSVALSLDNLADLYQEMRDYAKAEALYRRAFAIREKALGRDHWTVTLSLNNLAMLYHDMGDNARAEPLSLRALEIMEKLFGPDHADIVPTLNYLAMLYHDMGEYAKAEPLYRRALAIREKALGPDDPDVAAALNNLAALYRDMGDYAQAEPLFRRALGIDEKALGTEHPAVATDLNNLAVLYEAMGGNPKAEPLFQRALKIKEKALGPDHPDVAAALNNLAALYQTMGHYAQAEPLFRRALAIDEKALGTEHPAVATDLNNLAVLYEAMGDYPKAEPLFQRALKIKEKALGPDHPAVATGLNNLAALYDSMGDYAKAEPLYRRALAIREKALDPDHPDVATSLGNLGKLYNAIGNYAKAEPLFQRTLKIKEKVLGPDHPDVATALNNLALLYKTMGDYAKAEPLYRRALAIDEMALGAEHPAVATDLNNLAGLYRDMGDYTQAEPLYRRALEIDKKALGPQHPNVGADLNNLAGLYQDMGDYAKAEPLYQRSVAIWEQALGPEHPDVALSLNNLAGLAAAQQDYAKANRLFQRGLRIEERHIQNVFAIATEEQKLKFIQSIAGGYTACLSLIHQHLSAEREAVRDGLELVLRRKGVIFDAQSRAREVLQGRLSESARRDWDRLSSLRSELARLLLNKPEKISPEAYQEKISSLQQQIEAVEKRLADESVLVAKELKQRTVTVKAITKVLPKDAALVEFVKIKDFDFAKGKFSQAERYLAFVLTAAGDVTLVDLGEAGELEKHARQVLEHIAVSLQAPQRSQQSLAALYQRVWAPLQAALKGADKVVLSPDGQLNLVPFAALLDDQGRPLVEQYRLAYVTSGRELVATGTPIQPDSDLVLVANPAYDKKGTAAGNPGASRRSRNFRGSFDPLPGTAREAQEIPTLVSGSAKQKQVLVEAQATESAVKASRSPRILHLATHGFFLEDEDLGPDEKQRGPKGAAPRYENPLVRSGLAFAGANHAAESTGSDDGILTALEITAMDLYGTDLVVLSACETGVGEVKTGEGVYGLRRAFALAGAKNLMMSLWPVSDEVTASQMKTFYKNLQTMPPAEALRQAQLATIKELKTKFGGTAPPVLWAPFFIQGAQALGR